jgi:hypothetical protein
VPLVTRSWVNLVSARLGNFQVSPEWGLLIDQMWVHEPKRQQTTLAKEHS